MTATAPGWIEPDWPLAGHVRVLSTLRGGGVSEGPYASLNLAAHVGDRVVDEERVVLDHDRQRDVLQHVTGPLRSRSWQSV